MKKIIPALKTVAFIVCIFAVHISINAQSTIYFIGDLPLPIEIKFNKEEVFLLKKKTKKVCNMHREGKLIISFEKSFTAGQYGYRYELADEIQLNLTKNSVHYIQVKKKGSALKATFKELTEEEGKILFAKRKYEELFIYNEP